MEKKRVGFTLIELMIVMAIMAVLVGMILPRFKGMRDQASISRAQGELRSIKTALESYFITNGAYPTTSETVCGTYLAIAAANPRILTSALYDPFGATATTEYNYTKSANGLYYVVASVGPDGSQNLTGISATGAVTGTVGDDIYQTNAQ